MGYITMTLENEKAIDRLRDELAADRKLIRLTEERIARNLNLINQTKRHQCALDKETDRGRL